MRRLYAAIYHLVLSVPPPSHLCLLHPPRSHTPPLPSYIPGAYCVHPSVLPNHFTRPSPKPVGSIRIPLSYEAQVLRRTAHSIHSVVPPGMVFRKAPKHINFPLHRHSRQVVSPASPAPWARSRGCCVRRRTWAWAAQPWRSSGSPPWSSPSVRPIKNISKKVRPGWFGWRFVGFQVATRRGCE